MIVKLGLIINSVQGLNKLLATKLPVKIAFKLGKLSSKIQPDLKIHDEIRVNLIKELGEQTDPEKDLWKVKQENVSKWQEEMTKLLDTDVDISFGENKEFEKINIDDLGDVQIEANDLMALDWLFN